MTIRESDHIRFRVLGQVEALSYNELEVWAEGGLVCLMIHGADGRAHATAPPDLAQAIAAALRAAIREASAQLPVPDPGEGMLWPAGVTPTAGKTATGRAAPGA